MKFAIVTIRGRVAEKLYVDFKASDVYFLWDVFTRRR